MEKTILLSNGEKVLVNEQDFDYLSQFRWHMNKRTRSAFRHKYLGYDAVRKCSMKRAVPMHREIMGVLGSGRLVVVDHINHDTLDNRRENLRVCTHQENRRNSRVRQGRRYKGVTEEVLPSGTIRYIARIHVDQRIIYLGTYSEMRVAALAYDEAARKLFGEFACPNLP